MSQFIFYFMSQVCVVLAGNSSTRFFRAYDQLLNFLGNEPPKKVGFYLTDAGRSAIACHSAKEVQQHVNYTPFGAARLDFIDTPLIRFSGEWQDFATQGYPLGGGYRTYSPTMRRFSSPDDWSPFAAGGLNAYVYCGNDPVNYTDPDGHVLPPQIEKLTVAWLQRARNNLKRQMVEKAVIESRAKLRVQRGLRGSDEGVSARVKGAILQRAREIHKGHRSAVAELSPDEIVQYFQENPEAGFSIDYNSRLTAQRAINNSKPVAGNLGMIQEDANLVSIAVQTDTSLVLKQGIKRTLVNDIYNMRTGNFNATYVPFAGRYVSSNQGRPRPGQLRNRQK
ncbi:hypothetical protein D3C81_833930 [compost metagenome]